jgi:hypothetical protein
VGAFFEPVGKFCYFLGLPRSAFSLTLPPGRSSFTLGVLSGHSMQSFSFHVVVNCPLETVFAVYTDIERWRHRNLFGEIRWVKGNPWEEGSRLRIETTVPLRTTVDQVVQHFIPNQKVSYLSHVLGLTCETRITFIKVSEQQTAISVAMELVGKVTRSLGFALEPMIFKATKGFFDEFCKDCEATAQKGPPSKPTE